MAVALLVIHLLAVASQTCSTPVKEDYQWLCFHCELILCLNIDTDSCNRFAIGTQGVGPSWSGYAQINLDGIRGLGGWQWALWITVSYYRKHMHL